MEFQGCEGRQRRLQQTVRASLSHGGVSVANPKMSYNTCSTGSFLHHSHQARDPGGAAVHQLLPPRVQGGMRTPVCRHTEREAENSIDQNT